MEEARRQEEEEQLTPDLPFMTKAGVFLGTAVPAVAVDALAHWGLTGLALGGFTAFALAKTSPQIYAQARRHLPLLSVPSSRQPGKRTLWEQLTNQYPTYDEQEEPHDDVPGSFPHGIDGRGAGQGYNRNEEAQETPFESTQMERETIRRLSLEQICRHIEPNSYVLYLGRSLTKPRYPAVGLSFYKQHIKIIGASQKGKSSMAAAILEMICRTHDTAHVQIALLDLEHLTSRLFADLPHLATVRVEGQEIPLHARNRKQVLECLGYLVQIMDYRYTLPASERAQLPILLIYIEEFLALKNYFKKRIDTLKGPEQKAARGRALQDYSQLVFAINELSLRGLKARIQLMLCAQVDYADDDFREALTSVSIGMSFCVRPTAAQAAGFFEHELLKRNYQENQEGQAVVEAPGVNDLILAPDFPLEERLIAHERMQQRQWQRYHTSQTNVGRWDVPQTPETPLPMRQEPRYQQRLDAADAELLTASEHEEEVENIDRSGAQTFPNNSLSQPEETSDVASEVRPKDYRLSEQEIQQFISAYRACGNIDKALNALNRGARYRVHANEILAVYGLRKNA